MNKDADQNIIVNSVENVKITINNQILNGKEIHDDAATNNSHYIKKRFNNLEQRHGSKLTCADGTVPESPFMGTIMDKGETFNNVIYLPNIPYSIKSQFRLLEVEGWKIVDWTDTSIKELEIT